MIKAERDQLIEAIALKIDKRASSWLLRNNDFAGLYAAENKKVVALVRSLTDADLGTDG